MEDILLYMRGLVDTISGGDAMLKTLLMGSFSLALSGVLGFTLVKLPKAAAKVIRSQLMVTFNLTDSRWEDKKTFDELDAVISKLGGSYGSRTFSMSTERTWSDTGSVDKRKYTLGLGNHIIFLGWQLFFITKSRIDSKDSYQELVVSTFGRNKKNVFKILNCIKPNDEFVSKIFDFKENQWVGGKLLLNNSFENLCLNEELRESLTESINYFDTGREDYYKLGIPYKMTMLLHGVPGTGKTSLIRTLASHFKFNIAVINLSTMNDSMLIRAMGCLPNRTMVVLEDIDCSGDSATRELTEGDEKSKKADIPMGVSLSGLLNALDGVVVLDDVIVFMTTNYIDRLDPAILRPGRTERILELPLLTGDIASEYFNDLYHTDEFELTKPMRGCDISEIKNIAKWDVDAALSAASKFK